MDFINSTKKTITKVAINPLYSKFAPEKQGTDSPAASESKRHRNAIIPEL
jgi:hypothetical protein